MVNNNRNYLIRGYCPSVGFRYWYAVQAAYPFAEYPSSDPFYPPILPTNPYTDVAIYDIPRSSGGGEVDGYAPYDPINPPASGDLVYIDGYGYLRSALAIDSIADPLQANVAGVTTADDSFRPVGVASSINLETTVSPGERLYLSTTLPGAGTNVPPTNIGEVIVPIGIALTASSGGVCAIALSIGTPTIIT